MTVTSFAIWRREQGVSPATINKDLASILALWRWCHRQRLVEAWPNVEMELEAMRSPVAWTETEFNALLQAAMRQRRKVREKPFTMGDYWVALLLVCFDTGERIGAVRDLEWTDIDLSSAWITFRAENRKGGRRDNTLEVHPDTIAALRKLGPTKGLVFQPRLEIAALYKRFEAIIRDAGLPLDRRHKFHCIRRTTASHYEAAGGNATELLGHSVRRTTEAYLDPRIVTKTPPHELLWRPDCGSWTKGRKNKKGPKDA